jgi:hypothetical protein
MPWRIALLALPLLLFAACSSEDEDGVTVVPATPTAAATATLTTEPSTATPAATVASSPTPTSSAARAIFCEATVDGQTGYVRKTSCADGENGFSMDGAATITSTVMIGDFVPQCLQPAGDEGMTVVVGALCTSFAGGSTTLTRDPLPAELRGTIEDGELIPSCRIGNPPDWPIVTGPPCIQGGAGPARILLDVRVLEEQATCGASLSFIFVLINSYLDIRDTLAVLPRLSADQPSFETDVEAVRAALLASRAEIVGREAAPRVVAFFESWGDQSPLVINERTLELLDPLLAALADREDAGVPAVEQALVDHVNETLVWYVAGRGC